MNPCPVLRGSWDGAEFPLELTVTALREGGAYVFNAFVADITDRKRAEDALRQAQQRLEHVVSSSPAVLYSLTPRGQTFPATWISENVERLLGYTQQEALDGGWWPSHLHPEDKERVFGELAALFTNNALSAVASAKARILARTERRRNEGMPCLL